MSLLILGGTGTLGRQLVRKALDEGFTVKCLVRSFRKAAFLKEWGAELVYGDLKLPETIPLALIGITAIIDASTARPSDFHNASQIDLHGKYVLIKAAEKASIKRYIFFSILNANQYLEIPLMNLKTQIEHELGSSTIRYTIFALSGFFQGIIGQYALPLLEKKSVWITAESTAVGYLDTQDVARFAIKSLSIPETQNTLFPLVATNAWTSFQVIELCEKLSGQRCQISRVPISFLKLARQFTSFFQWTWNISERLAFIEVLAIYNKFDVSMKAVYKLFNIQESTLNTLEKYLQEYFAKVMKKLQEVNYKIQDGTDATLF